MLFTLKLLQRSVFTSLLLIVLPSVLYKTSAQENTIQASSSLALFLAPNNFNSDQSDPMHDEGVLPPYHVNKENQLFDYALQFNDYFQSTVSYLKQEKSNNVNHMSNLPSEDTPEKNKNEVNCKTKKY